MGVAFRRRRVAFEDRHFVPALRECERGAHAGNTAADDGDPFAWLRHAFAARVSAPGRISPRHASL